MAVSTSVRAGTGCGGHAVLPAAWQDFRNIGDRESETFRYHDAVTSRHKGSGMNRGRRARCGATAGGHAAHWVRALSRLGRSLLCQLLGGKAFQPWAQQSTWQSKGGGLFPVQ